MSNPWIRRVEKEEKEEAHFTTADFDADFDAEEPTESTTTTKLPWIPAEEIDYFTDCHVCHKHKKGTSLN